jgi:hypothetical protein
VPSPEVSTLEGCPCVLRVLCESRRYNELDVPCAAMLNSMQWPKPQDGPGLSGQIKHKLESVTPFHVCV